jgi:branched-chain amino acid transport system ATP-binding protein
MSEKFNSMPFFRVENICKSFGGIKAVHELSFDVERGEIFSIIGPNGAGKSTIFNCINGLYRPEKGNIWLGDKNISRLAPDKIARSGIARTFQNLELFSYMSAIDNLLLGRHLKMKSSLLQILLLNLKSSTAAKEEIQHRRKVEEIIDFLDLEAFRERPVFSLPYGIQKLVELGRALALEPQLLLLDEPAAGLNNEERQDMIFWIKDIRDELGITIIVIEHNMQLVKDISDRVMAINFGEKIAEGKIEEVLAHEEVILAYLGDAIH